MKKEKSIEREPKVKPPKWLIELKRLRELEKESAEIEKMNRKAAKSRKG